MVLARPAGAFGEVVLEVRVAAADVAHALERGLGQRRAPEVRVDDHARRVQHPPQPGAPGGLELGAQALGEVARLAAGPDLLARRVEHAPGGVDRERVVHRAGELVHRGEVSELHMP